MMITRASDENFYDKVIYSENQRIVRLVENSLDKKICAEIFDDVNILIGQINISNLCIDLFRPVKKSIYIFAENYYVYYEINGCFYVDLHHIIANIIFDNPDFIEDQTLVLTREMFHDFSENIVTSICDFRYDGKITRRDLIDIPTMARVILSRNSRFKEIFLVELAVYFILVILYLYYYNKL